MNVLLKKEKDQGYFGRKNGKILTQQVMIFIFSLRFRLMWKQIQGLSSCKIMLMLTNPRLQQGIFKMSRSPISQYSSDLNLIEHVRYWMKNWIQGHHWQVRYNVPGILLD